MKKLIFCFLISLITYTALAQEYGWTDISANLPEYSNYNDVHFIGDEGWITGWNDGLIYTPDGGGTFQIQVLPENSGISSSIFMTNNQEGYVVTFLGKILKTENGGTSWTTLHEPGGGLNSVHSPPSSTTGYTCGSNGTVWSFDDISITDISPPDNVSCLQSICFPESNNDGKVCGETTIARYNNNTWNNLQLYDSTLFYNSIFFINNTTGWAVGTNGSIILTSDGISWILQTSNTNENLNDIFFINSLKGWTVGTGVLLHTVDGGETWTQELASQTVGMELRAIYFTSGNNGYIVGNGTLLKYGELTSSENEEIPAEFLLLQNYPNPFNPETVIQYQILEVSKASLSIFDIKGRLVKTLVDCIEQPGRYSAVWSGKDDNNDPVSSGIYFYRLEVGNNILTKRMVLLK